MTYIQMTLTVELLMKAVTPPRQSVVCPGNNWNDFCVTTYSEQGCFQFRSVVGFLWLWSFQILQRKSISIFATFDFLSSSSFFFIMSGAQSSKILEFQLILHLSIFVSNFFQIKKNQISPLMLIGHFSPQTPQHQRSLVFSSALIGSMYCFFQTVGQFFHRDA